MQHWLEKLTDLAALPGDEHLVKQGLEAVIASSGFSGYAYLSVQPSHSSALSNYHPDWQGEYFRRRFNKLNPVIKRAQTLRQAFSWSAEWDRQRLSDDERSFFRWQQISGADRGSRSQSKLPMVPSHSLRWLLRSSPSTSIGISIQSLRAQQSGNFIFVYSSPI